MGIVERLIYSSHRQGISVQQKEAKEYDEKIVHLAIDRIALDLDDGVKVNYEKLQIGTDGMKWEWCDA